MDLKVWGAVVKKSEDKKRKKRATWGDTHARLEDQPFGPKRIGQIS